MIPFPPVYLPKAGYQWYSSFIPEMCGWCGQDLIAITPVLNYCANCGRYQWRRLGL